MTKTETILGLTPITKRLAYHFLCRGVGKYRMVDHPYYDEAVVEELYPWRPNPENKEDYGAGIKVTFYRKKEKVRHVEFGVRFIGGGGEEMIRLMD